MGKNRLYRLLSRIVDIKLGEETLAVLLFTCFFLITGPHTIFTAIRYADLLLKMGAGGLPLAYLSAAVVTGLVVLFQSKIHVKLSSQTLIISSLVFFIVSGLLFQVLFQMEFARTSKILPYLYWVWAGVFVIILMTHAWMIVSEVFNPREAKRLIAFCGSGGLLGGVVGGLLAWFLTRANLSNLLLPLACGLMFACIFVVRAIFVVRQKKMIPAEDSAPKKEVSQPQKPGFKDSFNAVLKNKYLILIASIVIIKVFVATFIDFQFSSVVEEHYRSILSVEGRKEAMQAFFALFYAALTAFAFFLNLFLTSRFLKTVRMRFIILLTPLVLLLCSVSIIFVPLTLPLVIILKGSDEGLAFSLHQSVRELLYIPVFPELKRRAKPFIDMFINRGAKVFAALLLLIYALSLNKEVDYLTPVFDIELAKALLWIIIGFLVIWTILSFKIFKEYVNAISQNIKERWPRADKTVADKLDVDYTKLIFDTVESKSRSSVLYAMHMFDLLEQEKLTPEIKEMITQKSEEVNVSSLGDLFQIEGATWFPENDEDAGQENFIADIREIMSLDAYQQVMGEHAEQVLEESKETEIEKMEMAKAIGLMEPDAPLVKKLAALIFDKSPEVSCYAIRSAARLQLVEHIPVIIKKLESPLTHEEAVSALKIYGHSAMNNLEKYIGDSSQNVVLRKAVVKVLAHIGTQDAVRVLLKDLGQVTEELESEIIDSLDHIRAKKTDLHFPAKLVQRVTLSIVKKYCQTFIDLHGMEPSEKNKEQRSLLEKKMGIYFWDIFKLLGLYYPHKNIVKARQNIKAGTPRSVAYAIEWLDNTLKKDMKDAVIPLVADLSPGERQKKFQKILRNF